MVEVHYVYIVRCKDDTLYTGYTNDIQRRIEEHNNGTGAKYTRGRTPVKLEYFEQYENKGAALSREHEIKKLSRVKKADLITTGGEDKQSLS